MKSLNSHHRIGFLTKNFLNVYYYEIIKTQFVSKYTPKIVWFNTNHYKSKLKVFGLIFLSFNSYKSIYFYIFKKSYIVFNLSK